MLITESGIGEDFADVRRALARGVWPPCYLAAREAPDGIAVIHNTDTNCTTCPLSKTYRETAALVGMLRFGGQEYGVLVVALPVGLADDADERSLFKELVGDIAYALHALGLETEHSEAAVALRESEEKYRSLFNQSTEAIYLHDLDGHILDVNEAACVQSGYSREELLNRTVFDGQVEVSATNLPKAAILRAWREWEPGEQHVFEAEHQRKDGTVYPVDVSAGTIRYGETVRILAIVKDITERRQAAGALRDSEEKYRTLVENAQQGVVIAQADPVRLRFANPAMCKITGYEEVDLLAMDARQLPVLIHPDDRLRFFDNFKKRIAGKDVPHQDEYRIVRKDGTERWVSLYSSLINYLGEKATLTTFVDITERKHAEEQRERLEGQLLQAQKMEAVGRLAGGVAHDFNNLLMGIMNYAELCRDNIATDHPSRRWLDEITREAERSANLTRQLLAFARKQTVTPQVLDVNDAVSGMVSMLHRLIGEDIDLIWKPGARCGFVNIDPGQLDQVLANLCINARDAISGAGKLTIETESATIDQEYCAEQPEASPGDYVLLAVSDDGRGMDVETLQSAFEPFFTTKGVGEGTGLGLATVYGIVRQNGGFVNVYSELGHGTTFRIYLPTVTESPNPANEEDEPVSNLEGDETILLVEDEPSIRKTLGMLLERFGYDVLSAEAPGLSLQIAADHPGPIHLLITDVVMPGMSGRDLAERLLDSNPSMKVLYMSGYTANVIAHQGILDEGVHFLSKPISSDELMRTVRLLLDSQ